MSKFKVGDKVQVVSLQKEIRGDCDIPVGCVGTVVSDYAGGGYLNYVVEFQDNEGVCKSWSWNESNLELFKEEGVKYDSDKLEYSLLPKGVLNKVVNVLGFGSKKYAKDNWMKVDNPKERYYNAAQRHINQWWESEKNDSETGENHLAHAICCLMFMLWFDNQEDKEVNK